MCPACGGALWEQRATVGPDAGPTPRLACRIGHAFEAAQLWVEHCAARNRALSAAARALAENAALARRLAAWTRAESNVGAATELERAAAEEDRLSEQVRRLAAGLPVPGRNGAAPVPEWPGPHDGPAPAAQAAERRVDALTPQQREIAVLIAQGLTNEQIARHLVITPGATANHVAHILERLGADNRAQVAAWAAQVGLHQSRDG